MLKTGGCMVLNEAHDSPSSCLALQAETRSRQEAAASPPWSWAPGASSSSDHPAGLQITHNL